MRTAAVWDTLCSMQLLCLAAILGACGGKTTEAEPVPEPALLGTYSPATAEQVSKSCRGSLAWNDTKSVMCIISADKPRRYYSVAFDANGVVTSVSFTGLERPEVLETFDRAISPIVAPSVRNALRASISTLGPAPTHITDQLLGGSEVLELADGTTPRMLRWTYSPVPAERR